MHHIISGIDFLIYFTSLIQICLLFQLISDLEVHHLPCNHFHHPSLHRSSKMYFSTNPSHHRLLIPYKLDGLHGLAISRVLQFRFIVLVFNPFKPSGAKWLHYKVFKAILV